MLTPLLLIGIGGSGGKTLRTMRHELELRLEAVGWRVEERGFPKSWQILHVDVPFTPDGNEPDLPGQLPASDYVPMVKAGVSYPAIDRAVTAGASDVGREGHVGWRLDPKDMHVGIERGAGQYRALGRTITLASLRDVKQRVEHAAAILTSAEVSSELRDLSELLGGSRDAVAPIPQVFIVSSMAGGSGSGAWMDIADVVRSVGEGWPQNPMAVLYAPDVFDHIGNASSRGVQPNALATLSEMMAAFWTRDDDLPADHRELLASKGVNISTARQYGTRYALVVGRSNGQGVTFGDQNEVFWAMGKSLAALAASEALQSQFFGYIHGNYTQSADKPDVLRLKESDDELPLEAIGFARLSLGRDRFARYSEQRIAQVVVDQLLRGHEEHAAVADKKTSREKVEYLAAASKVVFLEEVGLNERGYEANQVIDALRSTDRRARLSHKHQVVHSQLSNGQPSGGRRKKDGKRSDQYATELITAVHGHSQGFLQEENADVVSRGREWVAALQDRLERVTARYLAIHGARVTEALLALTEAELQTVREELRGESVRDRERYHAVDQQVYGALQAAGGELLMPQNPSIASAVERGMEGLGWAAEAELKEFAAGLLGEVATHLVRPMRIAVREAADGLTAQEIGAPGRPSATENWPRGSDVPKALRSARNEVLIDPVDEFPQEFVACVRASLGVVEEETALRQAATQALMGTRNFDTGSEQQVVVARSRWVPTSPALQSQAMSLPSPASFEVRLSVSQIVQRARAWVDNPETAMGRRVHESLADYLDEHAQPAADLLEHRRRFQNGLVEALDKSSPLVSVDHNVLSAVHGSYNVSWVLHLSEVPFPDGSPAAELFRSVLQDKGMWKPSMGKAFGEGRQSGIEFFTAYETPYEPVVFESIIRPIATSWAERKHDPTLRQNFWKWRRARPLPQFVPAHPVVRRAMVRGWFTANVFDQLKYNGDDTSIFYPNTGGLVSFPMPPIGRPIGRRQYERLPVVLESLPLALLDYVAERDAAMQAYWRLIDLGTDANGGMETYLEVNTELADWIYEARLPIGAPEPRSEDVGVASGTWVERRDAVAARLDAMHAAYARIIDGVDVAEALRDNDEVPMVWELREDVLGALDTLRRRVRSLPAPERF